MPTKTPAESETPTPSNNQETTPPKRPRELALVMIDEPISPKLHMPKPGQEVDASEILKIVNNFTTKYSHCFFMGRDFKFDVNIAKCHLAPPKKCVRAKDDAYMDWMITQIVSEPFKDDMQTIVVMPHGHKRMPTSDMWPSIVKGNIWLIDGQHSVEA